MLIKGKETTGYFRDEYFFLSNMYPCEVEYNGIVFKSSEHAYQAMKTTTYSDMVYIANAETAKDAKNRGSYIKIRPDWDNVKLSIMRDVCYKKFQTVPLRQMLIDTGDLLLVELNWWNDKFWGICDKTYKGKNHLGLILMEIRNSFKEKSSTKLGKILLNKNKLK